MQQPGSPGSTRPHTSQQSKTRAGSFTKAPEQGGDKDCQGQVQVQPLHQPPAGKDRGTQKVRVQAPGEKREKCFAGFAGVSIFKRRKGANPRVDCSQGSWGRRAENHTKVILGEEGAPWRWEVQAGGGNLQKGGKRSGKMYNPSAKAVPLRGGSKSGKKKAEIGVRIFSETWKKKRKGRTLTVNQIEGRNSINAGDVLGDGWNEWTEDHCGEGKKKTTKGRELNRILCVSEKLHLCRGSTKSHQKITYLDGGGYLENRGKREQCWCGRRGGKFSKVGKVYAKAGKKKKVQRQPMKVELGRRKGQPLPMLAERQRKSRDRARR